MAVADGKTRVMLTIGDALLAKVDRYCEEYGMSRSSFFSSCAADKFAAQDGVETALAEMTERLLREQTAQA